VLWLTCYSHASTRFCKARRLPESDKCRVGKFYRRRGCAWFGTISSRASTGTSGVLASPLLLPTRTHKCFTAFVHGARDSSIIDVNNSSACTTKRFPSPRCASAIQIVHPLASTAETQPQLQPALLSDFSSLRTHWPAYCIRCLYGAMAHVKNKFERKTKTGRRFHGRGIFFRQRVFFLAFAIRT